MFCVKCGAELADSEVRCPLCSTKVVLPDSYKPSETTPSYPPLDFEIEKLNPKGVLTFLTAIFIIPILVTLFCDMGINGTVTWSGYPIISIILLYIIVVLPFWFVHPIPEMFLTIDFVAIAGFLLVMNYFTNGTWFLTLALPITAAVGITVIAATTIFLRLRKGRMFVWGALSIMTGVLCMIIEALIKVTFAKGEPIEFVWSLYPLISCGVIGIAFIIIGMSKRLRDSIRKRMFI